jgi:homoserine O-acetyltransferase
MKKQILILGIVSLMFFQAYAQRKFTEGDFVLQNFRFTNGSSLSELKIHYTTLGRPKKNAEGQVNNAVLIMHGTSGDGHQFLSPLFAGNLFGQGQLLDTSRYYIILPDGIGHGKSSKPSNGLHMKFPAYTYDDMVRAEHLLVTQHLGINHLRLVMGTSMGGMHTWVWGYTYPGMMDALMPLASLPVEIAGRNRMMRKMILNSIQNDPQWNGGEYSQQPPGLTSAIYSLIIMVSVPLQWQKTAPTREAAEKLLQEMVERYRSRLDANDMVYQIDASRYYNPSPHLGEIKAPLFAINSADDQVNPPELGIMEKEIQKVKNGRYILLPITDQTSGHGTHSNPTVWDNYLKELLALSEHK